MPTQTNFDVIIIGGSYAGLIANPFPDWPHISAGLFTYSFV